MTFHKELYERLKEAARNGALITYGEIAPLADLNMESQGDRTKMGELLGEISTYEHEHGRPMLSAVVVLAESGSPGKGFYNLARYLELHHGQGELADMEFFAKELKRVYEYWQNP